MQEKLMEQKWMVAVFLLVVPALMRVFDLLTESGMLTVWLVVANAFFIADVTQRWLTKPPAPADAKEP